MNFSTDRTALLERLKMVTKAIAPNSPLAETGGVLFELSPESLTLTTTNKQQSIQSMILPGELSRLQVTESGREIIDGKLLMELLSRISDATVTLETIPGKVMKVITRDGDFNVKSLSTEKWPVIDFVKGEKTMKLSRKLLEDIVDEISHAAGTPEKTSRAILTGIHMELKNGVLEAAATDAFRMARKTVPMESDEEFSFTVPAKHFKDFVRSLNGADDQVEIFLSRKMVQFIYEKTLFQFQLLEGTYPVIRQIIPSEEKYIGKLVINPVEFKEVLDRSSLYNRYLESSCVRMSLSSREVKIITRTQEVGTSEQVLYSAGYEGQDLTLTYNFHFMKEALDGLKNAQKAEVDFTGPLSPMKVSNPDDDSVLMILVPVRDYL